MNSKRESITKRQHYVFQAYLREWAENNKGVFCLDKERNKITKVSTKDILFKKFFYEIKYLSPNGRLFLQTVLKKLNLSNEGYKQVLIHLDLSQVGYDFKSLAQSFCSNRYDDSNVTELKKNLLDDADLFNKTSMEDFHQHYEKIGGQFLKQLRQCNCDFYYNHDSEFRFNFLFFFCLQFSRTYRKYKESIEVIKKIHGSLFSDIELNIDDYESVAQYFCRLICCHTLHAYFIRNNSHLTIIKNCTNVPFITSDNPIVTIKRTKDAFVYYYPISPKIAITLNDSNQTDLIEL